MNKLKETAEQALVALAARRQADVFIRKATLRTALKAIEAYESKIHPDIPDAATHAETLAALLEKLGTIVGEPAGPKVGESGQSPGAGPPAPAPAAPPTGPSHQPPGTPKKTNVHVIPRTDARKIPLTRMPEDPLISNRLAGLAKATNEASRDLADVPSLDDLTDYTDARSGDRLERYGDAVANLSHGLHGVEATLKPLEPSVTDTWNPRLKAWRDQLETGVRKLRDQARILEGLIKKSVNAKEDDHTGTITPQAAGTPELEHRLDLIQAALKQVDEDIAASSEQFN
jgi:hypothetical protein